MSFSIGNAASWLPGIGYKSASNLMNKGVTVFEQLKDINPADFSTEVKIPINVLKCAKNIATNIDAGYLQTLTKNSLELSSKVAGIGLEFGVALLSQGISRLKDIKPSTLIDFSKMPSYFNQDYWRKIIFSVQLDLIPGLTKKNAWNIAYKSFDGTILNLQDFSSRFTGIIPGVSSDMVTKWKFIAGKLVEKGILDFEIAGNLKLARLIDGIGPQIAALLSCLGITEPEHLLKSSFNTISSYIPWINKNVYIGWLIQAFKIYVENLTIPGNSSECRIMLGSFIDICKTFFGYAQELSGNNLLNLMLERAESIKANLINKILTSSQFIRTKFSPDIGTNLQEIYNFIFGGFQANGSSFINNLLNNLKNVVEHPESRLQLFNNLGLDQLISGYLSPNDLRKGQQKAVRPNYINFGTIRERDSEVRNFDIISEHSDPLRDILLDWNGDPGSWLNVDPLEPDDIAPSGSQSIDVRLTIPNEISRNDREPKYWIINISYNEGGVARSFHVDVDAFVTYSIGNWVVYVTLILAAAIILAALAIAAAPLEVVIFGIGIVIMGIYTLFNWD